jgi:predicted site-specific integrase-resolvase
MDPTEVKEVNEFYTPTQLAEKLAVSRKAVTNWTQARRLPGMCRCGHSWRYERRAIDRALRSGELLLKKAE